MSLQSIANVTVSVSSKTVTQKGFGTPLFAGCFTTPVWPANTIIKTYDDPATMITEGFPIDHPLVLMAQAAKSQDPSVTEFKIGRIHSAGGASLTVAQTVNWTPLTSQEGTKYDFTLRLRGSTSTTPVTYTVPAAATIASICTAVAALISAVAGFAGDGASGTHVVITATDPTKTFDVAGWQVFIANVQDVSADPGYSTALAFLKLTDPDWYGLAVDINSDAIISSVAAWAEANGKLFGCNNTDSNNTMLGTFQALGYARSFGLFKADRLFNSAAAAWLGRMLPTQPGSATWCYKTLAGVAADDLLAQDANWTNLGINIYTLVAGVNITQKGVTFGGTFIDQTIGLDWLVARMQEALFGALVNNAKIPYTDGGIDTLRSVAFGIMQNGQRVGLLDPSIAPAVRAPKISEISANDRALRKVPGFVATARIAGAIHTLTMNIDLSI